MTNQNKDYTSIAKEYGLIPGSIWHDNLTDSILIILNELQEEEEPHVWCRILHITTIETVMDTMFWPYLIGLVKSNTIKLLETND